MPMGFPSGCGQPTARMGAIRMNVAGVSRVEPTPSCANGSNGTQRNHQDGPRFNSQKYQFRGSFSIAGVSRDSAGAALANCSVNLFNSGSLALIGNTISDGSGNYSFTVPTNSASLWVVMYKAGSPDVTGASVNTLAPVWNGN